MALSGSDSAGSGKSASAMLGISRLLGVFLMMMEDGGLMKLLVTFDYCGFICQTQRINPTWCAPCANVQPRFTRLTCISKMWMGRTPWPSIA